MIIDIDNHNDKIHNHDHRPRQESASVQGQWRYILPLRRATGQMVCGIFDNFKYMYSTRLG